MHSSGTAFPNSSRAANEAEQYFRIPTPKSSAKPDNVPNIWTIKFWRERIAFRRG